jgi:S1-C subfamily serine protease
MTRRRIVAALAALAVFAALGAIAVAQQTARLAITVTILDADQHLRPVPRHALLISENPSSAPPQRVVTALDGTIQVRLRPGNYTVESDEPLIFQGRKYEWTQTLDVPPGTTTRLELTAANAVVEAALAGAPTRPNAVGNASALLLDWQASVVAIWSQTSRGAGVVIDARGLIATTQRVVRAAKTVEVQLSPWRRCARRSSDPSMADRRSSSSRKCSRSARRSATRST